MSEDYFVMFLLGQLFFEPFTLSPRSKILGTECADMVSSSGIAQADETGSFVDE